MKESDPVIRSADEEDLAQLLELYVHLHANQPFDLDTAKMVFQQFKAYPGSVILVAEIGQLLVSSCTLVVVPNLTRQGRPYGLIENVVTHKDFRNRGLGKLVLAEAKSEAKAAGCYKVMLMTGSTKPETLAFYASAGFVQNKTGYQVRFDRDW